MKRIIFVFISFVFVMISLAGAQQKIGESDEWVTEFSGLSHKKIGAVRIMMQRDKRPGAAPGWFGMRVDAEKKPWVGGIFQGVCGESLTVELTVKTYNFDISAYRQSGSARDLPIADVLNVMKDALIEQCDQVQVIRVNFKSDMDPTEEYNYQGTLTRAGNWRLEDGYVPTAYDGAHRFLLIYRDPLSVGGVYHEGGCEENPLLLLEPRYSSSTEHLHTKTLNIYQFTELAKKIAKRYTQECPQTSRIQYILWPMPEKYRCADDGDECFLVAEKKSSSQEWEVDQSQFVWVDPRAAPIVDANDMTEVLAAGEFRIIGDYNQFFAFYYENFIASYSDYCRAHLKDPVGREIRTIETAFNPDGTLKSKEQVGPTRKIIIEREYAPGFDRYLGSWVNWAMSQMIANMYTGTHATGNLQYRAADSIGFLIKSKDQIEQALSGDCMNDWTQTVYQNMYNYAHGVLAITGKYTTDKKPAYIPTPSRGSAPLKTKMILDKRKAVVAPNLPPQPLPAKVTRENEDLRQTLKTAPQTAPSSAPDQPQVASPLPEKIKPKGDAVEPQRRVQTDQLEQQRAINKEVIELRRQHHQKMTAVSQAHRQQIRGIRDKEELLALKEAHRAKREAMAAELRRKIDQLRESQEME